MRLLEGTPSVQSVAERVVGKVSEDACEICFSSGDLRRSNCLFQGRGRRNVFPKKITFRVVFIASITLSVSFLRLS